MSVLEIETQHIKHLKTIKECSVFRLKLNGNSYIISSHCYLPISNIKIDNINISKENILVNSNWNDLLIIKDEYQVKSTFDKIRKKILPNGTIFLIGQTYECYLHDVEYLNFAMLPNYPKLMYYKIKGDISNIIIGDPILYINNGNLELVGLVSYIYEDYVLGLPSYYIHKTILRQDNNLLVPDIDDLQSITKINNYNIVNNLIWNKHIKFNIPIDVNFLLETDKENLYEINNELVCVNYIKYENRNIIINENYIMFDGPNYKLTSRLFHLLKEISVDHPKEILNKIGFYNKNQQISNSTSNIKINVEIDNKLVIII